MLKDGKGDLITVLAAFLLGIAACMIYDLLRIIRKGTRSGMIADGITDIIYAALLGVATFCLQLVRTSGEMRWFIFFGETAGFLLFRLTVSRLIMAAAGKIISCVRSVNRFFRTKVRLPIKSAASRIIISPIKHFSGFITASIKKNFKKKKKCVNNA